MPILSLLLPSQRNKVRTTWTVSRVGLAVVAHAAMTISVSFSATETSPPPVTITIGNITNWSGDTLVSGDKIDSLFSVLMTRKRFAHYLENRPVPEDAYESYPNPFSLGPKPDSAATSVSLRVAIEQSSYGLAQDARTVAGGTVLFGMLGAVLGSAPKPTALVQYRVRIFWDKWEVPTVAIAYGTYSPDPEAEDRPTAMVKAHKRALWNLAWSLTEAANEHYHLGLKRTHVYASPRDYARMADAWRIER